MNDPTDDDNSTPIPREDVLRIVDAVGNRAVLVGGQAVAWWAEFYAGQKRLKSVEHPEDLYVSKDADFLPGSIWRDDIRSLVTDVASRLRGAATHKFAFDSLVVGSVTYHDSQGIGRAVEFLRNLHGIARRESVLDTAVPFESDDLPTIYVMHPMALVESRVANAVDLAKYQTARGLLQARVAAEILGEWHKDQLDSGWEDAKGGIERTLKLAESKMGVEASARYDVDVLGTIPADHPALPGAFVEQRYRRCRDAVGRSIEAVRASSQAGTDG